MVAGPLGFAGFGSTDANSPPLQLHRMRISIIFRRLLPLAVAGCAAIAPLSAQTPAPAPPSALDQAAERAQREVQDRLTHQFDRDRKSAQPPSTLTVPATPPQKINAPKMLQRHIREIRLEGASLMGSHYATWLKAQYEGRDLSISDLEQLLADITAYYVRRGYVTTRAYVPPQDLSTGILRITIVEGRVERLSGMGWMGNIFPTGPGKPLNLRDLEQGIDNLNRLSSRHATLDLQPGTDAGETVVAVQDVTTRPWHVSLSADNTGTQDTGRDQASLGVVSDDPLSLGDQLSVNYRRAVPYRPGTQASEATTGSYIIPWGYQLFSLGGSLSSYALAFHAPSGFALPFSGDNRTAFLRTDRVIYRGQTSQLSLSGTLTWKGSRNYLLGKIIDISSRELTVLDLDVNFSTAWKGAFVAASLGGSRGLSLFGALRDPSGLPSYAPRAEYTKWTGSLSYSRPFKTDGIDFLFSSSLSGQVADSVLYGTEEVTVGGIYAVRGFDSTNLGGDSGYVWRSDLSLPRTFAGPFQGRYGRMTLRPYVGADLGEAWSLVSGIPNYSPPAGTLAGLTAGIAAGLGRFNGEVFYSKSIQRPASMATESGHLYVRLNCTF